GSAYPRTVETWEFRRIADEVDALLLCDMAHFAGLVAAGLHPNPVPDCDFVTSTTHKTLAGPRSGFVLCREEFAQAVDRAVFPGMQGGPVEPTVASGVRIGTPAATMRGFDEEDFREVGGIIVEALDDGADVGGLRARAEALCAKRPLYAGFRGFTTYAAS